MSEFLPRNIIFDEEVIKKLFIGAEKVYKAVSATYGIGGKLVGFENYSGTIWPKFTKDGVSVAKQIILADQAENIGAMLLIQAAMKQLSDTGDGTTLTVILAYEIIKAGLKSINSGINPTVLRQQIEKTTQLVIERLGINSEPVTPKLLHNVATISCNNDEALGNMIADAVLKVGEFGIVTHDKSKTGKTYAEYSSGYEFNYGIKWREFITNLSKATLELENPLILVSDKTLSWGNDINRIVQTSKNRPLVIISDEFTEDGEAFQAILKGRKEGYQIFNIKTNINLPIERKYLLADIAAICGTEVYGKEWVSFEESDFGTCKKIVSAFNKTTIFGQDAKRRIAELKASLSNIDDEYEKDIAKKSIARLSGGMAVIRVHAPTETEQNELLDRVDDAIRSCKSAQEEGIVNGGGVALLQATSPEFAEPDIIIEAIQKPIAKLLSNANRKSDLIIEKILKGEAQGYNIFTGDTTEETMIEQRICDPLKVIRSALLNAVSVAIISLQTSVLITVDKKEIK
jgi:chaperonin GroEL